MDRVFDGQSRWVWPLLATALMVTWSSGFVGIRYASEHASVALGAAPVRAYVLPVGAMLMFAGVWLSASRRVPVVA